jgi:hypothetical protein
MALRAPSAGRLLFGDRKWRKRRFHGSVVQFEKGEPAASRFVGQRERQFRVPEGRLGLDVQRRRVGDGKADRKAGRILLLCLGA